MPATDPFTTYETGMQRLLDHLGQAHPRYAEALTYQRNYSRPSLAVLQRCGILVT